MDLQTDYFIDEENAMLLRSVDPLVYQTVVTVVPIITLFDEIDGFIVAVD